MAFDLSELERLDAERPKPPSLLYKYVMPARVDVLEGASIRFTPPLNTNDIFEVRQTFELLAGPKFQAFFKEISKDVDFEEPLRRALDDSGLSSLTNDQGRALISILGGGDLEAFARGFLSQFIDQMPERINTPEYIDKLLERIASNQLLLSLSERPDSSPMWAHYAANSAGFVIAFDTSSEFFRRGDQGDLRRLHKIQYFDGRVGEMIDNPFAAINSKQLDWAYEREWRLYVKHGEVSAVHEVNGDAIHLVGFPREAVQRVILGLRTSSKDEAKIRAALSAYPGATLTRMYADRTTATLVEVPVE